MKALLKIFAAFALCGTMIFSFSACASGNKASDNSASESSLSAALSAAEKSADTKPVENAGNGKKVYFAGPMFNQSEKDFNLKLTKVLEENGYEVFLPQRDGIEAAQLEGKSEDELTKMIFALDAGKVKESDIVFMNLDGRVPDEGACVELGLAYAQGKRCYGFKTDTRSAERNLDLNPMIGGCMAKIFNNYDGDKLIEEIKEYLANNKL